MVYISKSEVFDFSGGHNPPNRKKLKLWESALFNG